MRNSYALIVIALLLLSGCNKPEREEMSQLPASHPIQPAVQENKEAYEAQKSAAPDPLEEQKQRLREYGIDCGHENVYGTRNSLAIDPQNTDVLYVGIEGRGVYKSLDKGMTWRKIINGLIAYPDMNDKSQLCFPDIAKIHIDATNTQHVLMVTSDITTAYVDWPYGETGGIWESFDGGESWKQLISGKVNVAGSGSLAVDSKNPAIMYYPVNPDTPTFKEAPIKQNLVTKGSIYKTVDGGKTWAELEMPMLPGLQATVIALDPQNSNHIVLFTQSHNHIYGENSITEVFLHKQHALLESFDSGKTWKTLGDTLPDPYRALFDGDISTNNFKHMIIRPFLFGSEFKPGVEQKSFYSTDGGKTFEETSHYIWVGRYNPHNREGNHLLGYTFLNAEVLESTDAGKTWRKIDTPDDVAGRKVKVENFVWDPKDSNVVYMSGEQGHVWQSLDDGKTWKTILSLETLPK